MKIFMTGATGLVGRSLSLRLARDGHDVIAWVRNIDAARAVLGHHVTLVRVGDGDDALAGALEQSQVVINLAGAPVAQRWTDEVREELVSSRVELTRRIVDVLATVRSKPSVLLSASAVGYYAGDRGAEPLHEDTVPGPGFLSRLCVDWEAQAQRAEKLGLRVLMMRIGIVLDAQGGALAKMRPAFALGLGAVLGSGQQWVPWIHLHDLVELFVCAFTDERYRGQLNATAPNPVTHREFAQALGRELGRPTLIRVPAFALRWMMGDAAQIVLNGHNAPPTRALERGFQFRFTRIRDALHEIIEGGRQNVSIGPATHVPDAPYLKRRTPKYCLEQRTWIDAPLDEVFDFFRQAENLGLMTPPALAFEIRTPVPIEMSEGRQIVYRIKLGPIPMRWLTHIVVWEPGRRFVDAQVAGPYRCWYHEHRFEADGSRTTMIDRVWYAPPLGLLGRIAQALFVGPMLRRIFGFRRSAISLRFGLVEPQGGRPTDSLAL